MNPYRFFPVTVLRIPAFSFSTYAPANLAEALKNDYFKTALRTASVPLYEQLEKKSFELAALSGKEQLAVWKYVNRICFRPTPFGLFAAVSAVSWGVGDGIRVGRRTIHTQASFAEAIRLGQQHRSLAGASALLYRLNTSIYDCGDHLRYLAAAANTANTAFEFAIASVAKMEKWDDFRRFCARQRSYAVLLDFIAVNWQLERTAAGGLLDELIELQLLTDNLLPNITGTDYGKKLSLLKNAGPPADLKILTCALPGSSLTRQQAEALKNRISDAQKVYVNTTAMAAGLLSQRYQEQLLTALRCLERLTPPAPEGPLRDFISAYQKKFGDRDLPLLAALDPEIGVGYQNLAGDAQSGTLLDDIDWGSKAACHEAPRWSPVHSFLLRKWQESVPGDSIRLDPEEVLAADHLPGVSATPPTLSIVFRISGRKLLVENAGGAGATAVIGRFTPFNQTIAALARAIAQQECAANSGVIFAEIAHVCDFHAANINRRRSNYAYEIPVLCASSAGRPYQLPLADLYVSLSEGEVVLYSKRLRKRVIPRMSSAFNYSRNQLSVFRFLGDLQYQGTGAHFSIDLRALFPDQRFYPRVELPDTVLHLATWCLQQEDFREITMAPAETRFVLFSQLARRLKFPRWIALADHDRQLVFDCSASRDVGFLLETIRHAGQITIREFLYPDEPDTLVRTTDGKPLINQFIASLYQEKESYPRFTPGLHVSERVPRRLGPGTDWLYYKISCHPGRADELLSAYICPIVEQSLKDHQISKWFFVRYADPEFHLRLRLHTQTCGAEKTGRTLNETLNRLLQQGLIADFTIAVYERELERYGQEHMRAFEAVFYRSSAWIAAYLQSDPGTDAAEPYHFALYSGRHILQALQINGADRIAYLEKVVHAFLLEFRSTPALKYQLDQKFRALRRALEGEAGDTCFQTGKQARAGKHLTRELDRFRKQAGHVQENQWQRWAGDILHMHFNRLFARQGRRQEFVLYYLWLKLERSQQARNRV
jgi:thiopeptide-type bacteriocin biosynthesis protein